MGAPFWSEAEKRYFLEQIVPRSHYANGHYQPNGRSFEELAPIMQRDLDDRNLSRRTYNGDLLFQHWYQKVRPTPHNVIGGSSLAVAPTPTLLPATPLSYTSAITTLHQAVAQDLTEADEDNSSLSSLISDNDVMDVSDQHTDDNATKAAMAGSTSPQPAPDVEENNEVADQNSHPPTAGSASDLPPPASAATDKTMEAALPVELPIRAPSPSPATTSAPVRTTSKKRASKGDAAQTAPSKKPKKTKKITPRVNDPNSDGEGGRDKSPTPRPRSTGASNNKMNNSTEQSTHSGRPASRSSHLPPLLPAQFDDEHDPLFDAPYRPRRPGPFPGPFPGDVHERERDFYSTASSNPYTSNPRPGPNNSSFQPHPQHRSSSTSRRPLPSHQPTHPFTQEDAEVVRLQRRHAVEFASNNNSYPPSSSSARYPPPPPLHSHEHVQGGPASASGGVAPGAGSGAHHNNTNVNIGGGQQMRIDPVTGQRLGEVTLQGTVMMTYCPSCQRPF
jgi:hypothetical protein